MQTFPRKREYGNFRHQAKIDCIQQKTQSKMEWNGKRIAGHGSLKPWAQQIRYRRVRQETWGTSLQESFTDSVFPAKIHYANSSLKPSHLSGAESDSMRRCRVFVLSRKYFWLRLKHDFTHFSQSWLIYFETIDILSVRLCHVMIHRFYLGFNILADYLHFAADILENVFFLQKYTTNLTLTRIPFSITILILNIDELESLIICTKYKNIYNIFILIHTAQHSTEPKIRKRKSLSKLCPP